MGTETGHPVGPGPALPPEKDQPRRGSLPKPRAGVVMFLFGQTVPCKENDFAGIFN